MVINVQGRRGCQADAFFVEGVVAQFSNVSDIQYHFTCRKVLDLQYREHVALIDEVLFGGGEGQQPAVRAQVMDRSCFQPEKVFRQKTCWPKLK